VHISSSFLHHSVMERNTFRYTYLHWKGSIFKTKEAHNAKKLVLIDSSLIGMKTKSLVAANRKYVREGFLTQRTEKGEWKKRYFFLFSDLLIRARVNRKQKGTYIFIEKVNLAKLELSRTLGSDVKDLVSKEIRNRAFEVNHPHPIRYILSATTIEEMNEWCEDIEHHLTEIKEAEAKHAEAVLKISSQKANVAKNLIAKSLMQHTVKVGSGGGGNLRERMQNAKSNQKSKTVDPSTIKAYAEQLNKSVPERETDSFDDNKTDNEDEKIPPAD